jgi:flavin reductase (DIM6/NTAB) family NADH-FMN oxidoreductase RutF
MAGRPASETGPVEFDLPVGGGFIAEGPEGIGEHPWETIPEEEPLEIAGEPGDDAGLAFRRILGMFATGVTIITTQVDDQVHGMTANAFMSVSIDPPLVLISVDKRARMHRLLREGVRYGVSVLADDQRELSDRFAGRAREDATEIEFDVTRETPLVSGALAHLVARVVRSYWGGDHSLFVGQVEYARYGVGKPLLFHGGQYEQLVASVPLFASLAPEILQPILAAGTQRAFSAGETIVREGEPGDELYVILEGTVRVERAGRLLKTFGRGEFFGEVAVLDGRPRSADVVAETAATCLSLPRDLLRDALASDPRAAWAMLETLAARLRDG